MMNAPPDERGPGPLARERPGPYGLSRSERPLNKSIAQEAQGLTPHAFTNLIGVGELEALAASRRRRRAA
jgi:hypothetical protein